MGRRGIWGALSQLQIDTHRLLPARLKPGANLLNPNELRYCVVDVDDTPAMLSSFARPAGRVNIICIYRIRYTKTLIIDLPLLLLLLENGACGWRVDQTYGWAH